MSRGHADFASAGRCRSVQTRLDGVGHASMWCAPRVHSSNRWHPGRHRNHLRQTALYQSVDLAVMLLTSLSVSVHCCVHVGSSTESLDRPTRWLRYCSDEVVACNNVFSRFREEELHYSDALGAKRSCFAHFPCPILLYDTATSIYTSPCSTHRS